MADQCCESEQEETETEDVSLPQPQFPLLAMSVKGMSLWMGWVRTLFFKTWTEFPRGWDPDPV